MGVTPDAVLGYSLGESTGLVANGVWRDRDGIYGRLIMSPLFQSYLGGEAKAVAKFWGLPAGSKVDWASYTVRSSQDDVRKALARFDRVYLLNVNTYRECVVGGDRCQVAALVEHLACESVEIPGLVAMHCPVVRSVAAEYEAFHEMDPEPVDGIKFYSCGTGLPYGLTKVEIAASLWHHGVEGVNYPLAIERAYNDGIRVFLDMGPGRSLARIVSEVLGDREHVALSMCPPGRQEVEGFIKGVGHLFSLGLEIDLEILYRGYESHDEVVSPANSRRPALRIPVSRSSRAVVAGSEFGVDMHQNEKIADALGPASGIANMANATNVATVHASEASHLHENARRSAYQKANRLAPKSKGPGLGFNQDVAFPGHGEIGMDTRAIVASMLNAESAVADAHESFLKGAAANLALIGAWVEFSENFAGQVGEPAPWLDWAKCKEFAAGKIGNVLGPEFAAVDSYPTRVRLPDGPLLLCHRIVSVDAVPKSMSSGRLITEHDVAADAWYLDCGRIPTSIAVESGQADLFLSAYLGIDFHTKGNSVYRLLDAIVTFYRPLPGPGTTIRYDIKISEFFSQGSTTLFRFSFEATIDGMPFMSMEKGCAGFFTEHELAEGRGIVLTSLDRRPIPGKLTGGFAYPRTLCRESYGEEQLDCLRVGDFAGCFGSEFNGLNIKQPGRLPGGMMRLVHRITDIAPESGRYGLGVIRGEADIHEDDWFLECHFVDDKVMPGTLMYECCLHTLRVYLMRMGWVGEEQDMFCEPIPDVASRLKCRGQVLTTTKKVTYDIVIKELGYRPEAYAIVDAFMYADGKMIVEITNMSARMPGLTKGKVDTLWAGRNSKAVVPQLFPSGRKPAVYSYERIRAFCEGKPSEAFGEQYQIFDGEDRKIARLPREPFCFVSRITEVGADPWVMRSGGKIEAEYDVPADAWYFAPERRGKMPFAVLLEAALQPCGWFSGYMGSALQAPTDLSYRNLGGIAVQHCDVVPDIGTLRTEVTCTKVSQSGGMIIQEFDFAMAASGRPVYSGHTMFGFFNQEALLQQVGIRGVPRYQSGKGVHDRWNLYPDRPALPVAPMLMVDEIQELDVKGGSKGLGFVRGRKRVDPDEWFFLAHFYQDPVMPGSLGLEAFVQLLKLLAGEIFAASKPTIVDGPALGMSHEWTYRGQVIPSNHEIVTEAEITAVDSSQGLVTACGHIFVDGLPIYSMKDFTVQV
jgi:3-hydroxymyristoyl/3-hydroxydecanoyl-(acyl carrier protein) dehydratase/malonyl CoA-acyl carrier protein transacylase